MTRLQPRARDLWARALEAGPAVSPHETLAGGTVIAEIKRRSPSGGDLLVDLDPADLGRRYVGAGAAAISILTDGPDFGGSLDDLVELRAAVGVPILRKDFVLDPLQVAEARAAGADWVLLIVRILDDGAIIRCLEAARRCGAHAVVEAHSPQEVERAATLGSGCIAINNRDLDRLTSDLGTFGRLASLIPAGRIKVAASGTRTVEDVRGLITQGADGVLVGQALLGATSPERLCAAMVEAARAAGGRPPGRA